MLIRQFSAGDIDPYGCPFVDPVPWVSEEAHQEVCGPGCTPVERRNDFIACFGEDVPDPMPTVPTTPASVPLCHPVSGERYSFPNPDTAERFTYLCFGACGDAGLIPFDTTPEQCFED